MEISHRESGGDYQPIGVPMAGIDRSTARAIAVVALLFVAAWALRGYLPGSEPVADRERPPSSPAALIVDIALLAGSVVIIGIAIVSRLRNRQARRPGAGQLPASPGTMGRPTWRFSLIALGLLIGWLALVYGFDADGRGKPRRSAAVGVADRAGPGQRADPYQSDAAATGFAGATRVPTSSATLSRRC